VIPEGGAKGVIVAQGGMFGGWSIYVKDGCPTYCYNLFGLQYTKIEGKKKIPAGEHQVRMESAYDGGGLGKGAKVSLYIDGQKTGEGRIDRSTPMLFSLDDKTNVGCDRGTPVSDDYTCAGSAFNGRIDWIQIDLGEDAKNPAHMISAEQRFNLAMELQ
jgi:arylsulfatase